jgi:predicted ATPase
MLHGRASVALGEVELGIVDLRKGYDLWKSAAGGLLGSEYGGQAADALLRAGQSEEARRFIEQAKAAQDETDERLFVTELLRLGGWLLEIDGDDAGAQEHYLNALDIAEQRGFKLFSLRAACNLAKLWQRLGRDAEARQLLEPLYGWFTEGFAFSDLREARALLDSLQQAPAKTLH